jgi:hypothetical protein
MISYMAVFVTQQRAGGGWGRVVRDIDRFPMNAQPTEVGIRPDRQARVRAFGVCVLRESVVFCFLAVWGKGIKSIISYWTRSGGKGVGMEMS